jgi:hypothetical protein
LNAELSVWGHTEAAAANLTAVDGGIGVADTSVDGALELAASAAAAGARLVGTTNDTTRTIAIGTALGRQMIALATDANNANDDSTFHAYARHFKGDTAYAIDNDVENMLLTVSNPDWPNLAGIQATTIAAALPPANDIENQAGGGQPTANWTRYR